MVKKSIPIPKHKRKRCYDTRRIKRDYPYTLQEIAKLYSVHKSAVRQWLKRGLQKIDKQKPILIHGRALLLFLKTQQQQRKSPLKANEFYCLKCRAPRMAYENAVDIVIQNNTRVSIQGLCAVCETSVRRVGRVKHIPDYKNAFFVMQQRIETQKP
jgi:predicted DNA-binding protein YlxM (UPF0122 family)